MHGCALCLSTGYHLKHLAHAWKPTEIVSLPRDVVHLQPFLNEGVADVFVFEHGGVACWGMTLSEGKAFLEQLKQFELEPLDLLEVEEFSYQYGDPPRIHEDELILPNSDILTKLALSYAWAQSVKLGTFEILLQRTFNTTKLIPIELAKHGHISLSRRAIRRKMGELFVERSSINLHVDALDTPDFFWEFPELETLYRMMTKQLDMVPRVEVLNRRLDVVNELFQMLGNELNHQHSSRLEWTIIWLIIMEVALSLLIDVFRVI